MLFALNCHLSIGLSPNCRLAWTSMYDSISVSQRIKTRIVMEEGKNQKVLPLAVYPERNKVPLSSHCLPLCPGEKVVVIEASLWRGSSAATTATAPYSSCPAKGSILSAELKVISSKVASSSPVHSPICKASPTMTSSLARKRLNAVALSVSISGLRAGSWLLVQSLLASVPVHFTIIVIGVISSRPSLCGDRREVNR